MLSVSKQSYDSSKSFGREEAFAVLGVCSLAKAVLVDDDNPQAKQDGEEEYGLIWLSLSGTVWLRASWHYRVRVQNVL